jgi:hypothetical protein
MDNEARKKCQPFLEEIRNNNKESQDGTTH